MKADPILLCMDMDRTALPNGHQEESPHAREILRRIAQRPEMIIAYVSGRRKQLQIDAIRTFDVPPPAFGVADVGTTIYEVQGNDWTALASWQKTIAASWGDRRADAIRELLGSLPGLQLQEPDAQGPFKLSFTAAADFKIAECLPDLERQLNANGFRSSLIWSVDETTGTGLLDILPKNATKRHAVEFLVQHTGVHPNRMVYAGDSGNDLPVLTSGLQAVLVANAIPEVRAEALREVQQQGHAESLYIAQGGFLNMNGNYAAGVLEGLAHFLPETKAWMC